MPTIKPWVYAAIVAGLLAAGAGAGWTLNGWQLDARASKTAAKVAEDAAKRSGEYVTQLQTVNAARAALATQLAGIDKQRTEERDAAKKENDRLSACVRTGKCGLRINATCTPAPGSPRDVPPARPGSGVDTDAAPRLTADAERDYFALREAIGGQRTQLAACVDALGRITGQRPAMPPGAALTLRLAAGIAAK